MTCWKTYLPKIFVSNFALKKDYRPRTSFCLTTIIFALCLNQLIFDLQRAVRDEQLYTLKHIDALLLLRAHVLDDNQSGTFHFAPHFHTTCYDAKGNTLRLDYAFLADSRPFYDTYEILAHRDYRIPYRTVSPTEWHPQYLHPTLP